MARTGTNESALAKELINQGADVIEFPRWTRTKAPTNTELIENISSYKKILFTSPESVTDFFVDLLNQRIDVRSISATLFGESKKSINAIQEKGLLAEFIDEMDDLEHTLVVGDNYKQQEYDQHDFYLTSCKKVDEKFLPLLARMLGEAQVNTILFPSSSAVKVFMDEGVDKGYIEKELLEKAEIVCLGEKTKNSLQEFSYQADLIPESPSKEGVVNCLRK
jgi:uroporphyrinogen III methyltransferase / synthase